MAGGEKTKGGCDIFYAWEPIATHFFPDVNEQTDLQPNTTAREAAIISRDDRCFLIQRIHPKEEARNERQEGGNIR